MMLSPEAIAALPSNPIWDTRTGYAVNVPLALQAPAGYWFTPYGAAIRARIMELRANRNITVDDGLPPEDAAETKANVVRRVASAEGEARFHLPKGAIIKPGAPEFSVNQVTVHHSDIPNDPRRAVVARSGPTKMQAAIYQSPSEANQAITDILNNNPQLGHVFHEIRGRRFIHQNNGEVHAQMKSGAFEHVGSIDATTKGIVSRPSAKFAKRTGMNPKTVNQASMRDALEHFVAHVPGETQSDRDNFRVTQNLRDVLTSKDNEHMRSAKAGESVTADGQPIPPGWTQVEVAKDGQWAVQARGRDAQGNVVRLASQAAIQAGLTAKRARTQALHDNMPHLDHALAHADLNTDDTAAVVYLMRHSGARVDSSGGKSTRLGSHAHQAFGATSIQARHVKVAGSTVRLSFIGKAGKLNRYEIKDKKFADAMRTRLADKEPTDSVFDTDDAKTAAYIRKNLNVTTNRPNHDMRSYFATTAAADLVAAMPESELPTSERDYTAKRNAAADHVAALLNDGRAPVLGTYIDPSVWTGLRAKMPNPDATEKYHPMSDKRFNSYVHDVQSLLKQSQHRATDQTYQHDGVWDPDRETLHKQIVNDMFAAQTKTAKQHRKLVFAGGLGGAGKSTTLAKTLNQADYVTVNPDDVKEEMAKRGMVPHVIGLSPMESAALVHEESSKVANMLQARALAEGYNVILDATMSRVESAERKLKLAQAHGYKDTQAVFVDIPVEESVNRAMNRYRQGMEEYRQGKGLGGRFVPPEVIRMSATPDGKSSHNKENFEAMKDQFTGWQVWDTTGSEGPKLVAKGGKQKRGS